MNQREHTLDDLTEGNDIADYKDEARAFLSALMELTPDEAVGTVVPVARRLLAYPDWRDTMTALSVLDFCLPGVSARCRWSRSGRCGLLNTIRKANT